MVVPPLGSGTVIPLQTLEFDNMPITTEPACATGEIAGRRSRFLLVDRKRKMGEEGGKIF
jgi:hypothetical protein